MKLCSLFFAAGLVAAPVCLSAAAPAAASAAAKTYPVSLNPAWKVGEKFGVASVSAQTMAVVITVTPPGQPAQPVQQQAQKLTTRLEADAEVLAVFPNGGLQKVALTVKKFTGVTTAAPEAAPAEKDLLPAGAKIVAEQAGGKPAYTVDGKPAAAELLQFLNLVVELDEAGRNDQELFGPKGPVAIGATWPVNGALVAEELKGEELGAAVTAKGTMRLDAIKGEGDAQVASVSGMITIENLAAPFPPPFAVKTADAKMELTGTQPAVHKGVRVQTAKMTMKLVAEGTSEGALLKAAMDMAVQGKSEITYR